MSLPASADYPPTPPEGTESVAESAEVISTPEKRPGLLRRIWAAIPFLILAVFLAQITTFFVQRAIADPIWKGWGDPFSDNNVIVAGDHFAERGFFKLKGLGTDVPQQPDGPYTGWPPLADQINYYLRQVGVNTLVGFRYFALATFVLYALYLYAFCVLMFKSRWAAAAAVMIACIMPHMYNYSDSLHEHMYYEFFRAALLYHFVKYYRTSKIPHLVLGMLFAFLNAYTSWEHIPFMMALFVAYPLLFRAEKHPRVTWKKLTLFGAAVCLALALFFVQVMAVLGGPHAAFISFKERFLVRTVDKVTGEYFKSRGSNAFLKETTAKQYWQMNF